MDTPSAASLRLRLKANDAETALLHAKLAELAAARRVIVEQLKCITFPAVLELPVELTSQIFIHYAQEHIDISKRGQLDGPFVLASVCQSWRTIALGLHQLWSRIVVNGRSSACQERRLNLCLKRSGTFADLDIDFADNFSQQHFLPSLADSAERLSRLDMFAIADGAGFKEIRGRLPRLRALKLWSDYGEEEEANLPILAFDDAPMLRAVKLVGIGANIVVLPWAQLVYLDLGSDLMDPLACSGILRQTPNLETLCLHIPNDPLPLDESAELRLERLQTLTLTWSRGNVDAARSWINLLTSPALVDFTTDLFDDWSTLRNMLTRSECEATLRFLTLNTKGGYTGQIKSILAVIPFLTRLTMTEIAWNELDNLFHALRGGPNADGSTVIHELRLEMTPGHIPYRQIARFVSTRTGKPTAHQDNLDTGHGLRRLDFWIPAYRDSVEDSREIHPDVLGAVEKLQSIALCPGMPELNISAHKASFVIQSSRRKPPPMHTLSD
ncbi:hypothetical protein C8F01DRAFT_1147280 [Mycena amicta]|nr:hypothetical protein C8F01DRAFT_1147280 [Mycena amicta]